MLNELSTAITLKKRTPDFSGEYNELLVLDYLVRYQVTRAPDEHILRRMGGRSERGGNARNKFVGA